MGPQCLLLLKDGCEELLVLLGFFPECRHLVGVCGQIVVCHEKLGPNVGIRLWEILDLLL